MARMPVKECLLERYRTILLKQMKGKVYPLLRKEREEMQEFIQEQLRKEYIRLLKSSQIALVFFVEKKVRSIWYRTIGI